MRIGNMAVGSLLQLRVKGVLMSFRVMHHGKPSEVYDDSFLGGTVLMLDWQEAPYYQNVSSGQTGKRNYPASAAYNWLGSTFLGYLDDEVQAQVVEVKLPYRTDTDGEPYEVASGSDGVAAKIWLPSAVEVARGSSYQTDQSTFYVEEGAVFDYWKGAGEEQYADWACLDGEEDDGWATRTMNKNYYGSGANYYNWVSQNGLCIPGTRQKGNIRPCLVLPDELLVVNGNVTTAANFPVKVGGVWKDGTASVKCGGVWNAAAAAASKVDGVWKE